MKNLFPFIFLIFILTTFNFAQNVAIKSLKTYTSDNNLSFPVLAGSSKIIIEFDVDADYPP
ncbi:MAG: hypothetical protein MUO34_09365, partial [Ignavibacteriaceae bacterium]|nr:hypothetical protein [Ignavibacteriaceae bacterium]